MFGKRELSGSDIAKIFRLRDNRLINLLGLRESVPSVRSHLLALSKELRVKQPIGPTMTLADGTVINLDYLRRQLTPAERKSQRFRPKPRNSDDRTTSYRVIKTHIGSKQPVLCNLLFMVNLRPPRIRKEMWKDFEEWGIFKFKSISALHSFFKEVTTYAIKYGPLFSPYFQCYCYLQQSCMFLESDSNEWIADEITAKLGIDTPMKWHGQLYERLLRKSAKQVIDAMFPEIPRPDKYNNPSEDEFAGECHNIGTSGGAGCPPDKNNELEVYCGCEVKSKKKRKIKGKVKMRKLPIQRKKNFVVMSKSLSYFRRAYKLTEPTEEGRKIGCYMKPEEIYKRRSLTSAPFESHVVFHSIMKFFKRASKHSKYTIVNSTSADITRVYERVARGLSEHGDICICIDYSKFDCSINSMDQMSWIYGLRYLRNKVDPLLRPAFDKVISYDEHFCLKRDFDVHITKGPKDASDFNLRLGFGHVKHVSRPGMGPWESEACRRKYGTGHSSGVRFTAIKNSFFNLLRVFIVSNVMRMLGYNIPNYYNCIGDDGVGLFSCYGTAILFYYLMIAMGAELNDLKTVFGPQAEYLRRMLQIVKSDQMTSDGGMFQSHSSRTESGNRVVNVACTNRYIPSIFYSKRGKNDPRDAVGRLQQTLDNWTRLLGDPMMQYSPGPEDNGEIHARRCIMHMLDDLQGCCRPSEFRNDISSSSLRPGYLYKSVCYGSGGYRSRDKKLSLCECHIPLLYDFSPDQELDYLLNLICERAGCGISVYRSIPQYSKNQLKLITHNGFKYYYCENTQEHIEHFKLVAQDGWLYLPPSGVVSSDNSFRLTRNDIICWLCTPSSYGGAGLWDRPPSFLNYGGFGGVSRIGYFININAPKVDVALKLNRVPDVIASEKKFFKSKKIIYPMNKVLTKVCKFVMGDPYEVIPDCDRGTIVRTKAYYPPIKGLGDCDPVKLPRLKPEYKDRFGIDVVLKSLGSRGCNRLLEEPLDPALTNHSWFVQEQLILGRTDPALPRIVGVDPRLVKLHAEELWKGILARALSYSKCTRGGLAYANYLLEIKLRNLFSDKDNCGMVVNPYSSKHFMV